MVGERFPSVKTSTRPSWEIAAAEKIVPRSMPTTYSIPLLPSNRISGEPRSPGRAGLVGCQLSVDRLVQTSGGFAHSGPRPVGKGAGRLRPPYFDTGAGGRLERYDGRARLVAAA